MRILYVGHATVAVELDGIRFVTDPVLRGRVAHLRRVLAAGAAPQVDAILVSHAHYDHLDRPTLRRFDRHTPIVVPRGLRRLVRRFERIVELSSGEETAFGPVRVRATHAEHPGSRPPFFRTTKALGFALLGSRRVYFAGDTDLFPAMEGLVPDLDVALLPISGWGPRVPAGHLDPQRAAEALTLLRPRVAVPIHWGTFGLLHRQPRAEALRRPVDEFARAAAERAPQVEVRVLQPGESLDLS